MSNRDFTFSIVIAVYNTEKYLVEAIESVINQSYDFNKIQIILVDDGSTDSSVDICHSYKNKYPDNVYYLRQENAGQSVARNNGLKIAKGRYVNFLDSDDKLSLNALEDVYSLFSNNEDEIDVVVIPRYYFDAIDGQHYLNHKYTPTRVVDIEEEYDFPQVAINASFIKRTALTDQFDPRVVISEDSLLINKTIIKKGKYGVVSTAKYYYRKRIEQNSTIDTKKLKREYFIPRMKYYFEELLNYTLSLRGYVLRYIQTVLMYDVQWYFLDNTHYILSAEELQTFNKLLVKIIKNIDDDIIFSQRFLNNISEYKCLLLKYDEPDFKILSNEYDTLLYYKDRILDKLSNNRIVLTDIQKYSDMVHVKCYYNSCFDNIQLKVFRNNDSINVTKIENNSENSINTSLKTKFAMVLELNEGNNDFSFYIYVNSYKYPIKLSNSSDVFVDIDNNILHYNY